MTHVFEAIVKISSFAVHAYFFEDYSVNVRRLYLLAYIIDSFMKSPKK